MVFSPDWYRVIFVISILMLFLWFFRVLIRLKQLLILYYAINNNQIITIPHLRSNSILSRDYIGTLLKRREKHVKIKLKRLIPPTHAIANQCKIINSIQNNNNFITISIPIITVIPVQLYLYCGITIDLLEYFHNNYAQFQCRRNKSAALPISHNNFFQQNSNNIVNSLFHNNEYVYAIPPITLNPPEQASSSSGGKSQLVQFIIPTAVMRRICSDKTLQQLILVTYSYYDNHATILRQEDGNRENKQQLVCDAVLSDSAIGITNIELQNIKHTILPGQIEEYIEDGQEEKKVITHIKPKESIELSEEVKEGGKIKSVKLIDCNSELIEMSIIQVSINESYNETGNNNNLDGNADKSNNVLLDHKMCEQVVPNSSISTTDISSVQPISPSSPIYPYNFKLVQQFLLDDRHAQVYEQLELYGLNTQTENTNKTEKQKEIINNGENSISKNGAETSKKSETDSEMDCIVCLTDLKDIILLPCRHVCVCYACLKSIHKCPVCRSNIKSHCRVTTQKQSTAPQPESPIKLNKRNKSITSTTDQK